ncbi:MAG: HAMP domain-containing protein [Gemmatimonadetes bacterium]|nr:HAMP domain-containing protein [Gemmatimonadota bacterium]
MARLWTAFLRVPLFWKILLANAVIVAVVVLVCHYSSGMGGLVPVLVAGVLLSALVNAVLLRLALGPLHALEATAERVSEGDGSARVPASPVADRDLERLRQTFNSMLETGTVYRQRLREITARALAATEEERKRIARELHDGIAQSLAALRIRLRVARAVQDERERAKLLEQVSSEMGEAMEELRRIARGLRPPALDMLGLGPAIESHARNIADATGMAMDLRLEDIGHRLPPDAELALYRVIQEALSNIARHSGADTFRLQLGVAGNHVHADVEDNGRGFDVAAAMSSNGGLGLFGMQERAGYVGGTVAIDSEPGTGTRVHVLVPIYESARYAS